VLLFQILQAIEQSGATRLANYIANHQNFHQVGVRTACGSGWFD